MPVNPYDEVPYRTLPQRQTHPDRLGAVGKLFGMNPAPVRGCRVLEVGCGNASNLIPMAYALPESRFTGIDLAEEAMAAGQRTVAALKLSNCRLELADICNIGAEYGEFDYIVAHGVYSWVPAPVRDRLLALCAERLAPEGIAYVSYNAYPGRHMRQMLREMMLYHTRRQQDTAQRVEQAQWFLNFMLENKTPPEAWDPLMESEIRTVLRYGADNIVHDDIAEFCEPFYFHQFMDHAMSHRLQFLGEADAHEMFNPAGKLDWLDDRLEREQYIDFLRVRRFRQTLLCREGIALRAKLSADQMGQFWFSAPTTTLETGELQGAHGIQITSAHEAVKSVALALGEVYPLPLSFDELVPYAGDRGALEQVLFGLIMGGFADIHSFDFPCEETVTNQPQASRLVRYQALQSNYVTNVCHQIVQLDDVGRQLVLLMDGTRDYEKLVQDLAADPEAPPVDQIREHMLSSLRWLARMALLEG